MLLFLHPLLGLSTIVLLASAQSTISIGIIDEHDSPPGVLNIVIPNITFCHHPGLILQIRWINPQKPLLHLLHELEARANQTHVYLAHMDYFSTKLIQGLSQTYRIPFVTMNSQGVITTTSLAQTYFVMPNILRVLISYLKYHSIRRVVYIYDKEEAKQRIYEFLQLTNNDEYFNNFSLDIRATQGVDVYSLLYSLDIHSNYKEHPPKYILLDLELHTNYTNMFEKIAHMGLTSDLYYYILLSSFDVCTWMAKVNRTGHLIYFDYHQHDCRLDQQPSSSTNQQSGSKSERHASYYSTALSFRIDHDRPNSSNFTQSNNSNSSNINAMKPNSCTDQLSSNVEYFSYPYFLSQLRGSSQKRVRPLYDALNFVLRLLHSNTMDCRTLRLKPTKMKTLKTSPTDINIYAIRKPSLNALRNPVELTGRYSSMSDDYRPCYPDKRKDLARKEKEVSSRTYYITSLFDEPFLMLRKRTVLHTTSNQPQVDLKELRGRVFDFHEVEGFCVDLAERVCSILNITCKFRIVQDGGFGSKNSSTGIWNGMVGEIVSRMADMAIAPLTISQVRMEAVDFSKPFMNLGISIMVSDRRFSKR